MSRLDEIGHDLAALLDVLRGEFRVGDGDLLDEFVIVQNPARPEVSRAI